MKAIVSALVLTLLLVSVPAVAQTYLDGTNVSLSGGATVISYEGLSNVVNIAGSASATWTVTMTPGQKYYLDIDQWNVSNTNCSFGVYVNGVEEIWDLATSENAADNNTFSPWQPLGYLLPTAATNTITVEGAGPWSSLIASITVTPTNDVYFDQNTPNVTLTGNAVVGTVSPNGGWPYNPMMMPIGGPNVWYLTGAGASVSGNVTLVPGQQYAVYCCANEVSASDPSAGLTGFDINLNGSLFVHDTGICTDPNHDNFIESDYMGTYTATTATTSVLMDNPGAYAGRPNYLQFVAVPEPGSLLALLTGIVAMGGLVIRRKK